MIVCPECNCMFWYVAEKRVKDNSQCVILCANPECGTVYPTHRYNELQDLEDLSESA